MPIWRPQPVQVPWQPQPLLRYHEPPDLPPPPPGPGQPTRRRTGLARFCRAEVEVGRSSVSVM